MNSYWALMSWLQDMIAFRCEDASFIKFITIAILWGPIVMTYIFLLLLGSLLTIIVGTLKFLFK